MADRRDPYPTALSDAEWAVLERLLPPPAHREAAQVAAPAHGRRHLLPRAVRLRLADAASGVPALAQRVLPTRALAPRRHAPPRPRRAARPRPRRRGPRGRAERGDPGQPDREGDRRRRPGPRLRRRQARGGRKRHVLVDTLGLVLLAHVHAADLHDRLGARELVASAQPRAAQTRAGLGRRRLRRRLRPLAAERGWRVEVPKHRDRHLWRYGLEERPKGFRVVPRCWVVERTFAWLARSRRLARDYERLPETRVAMIHAAMSRIMLRRVAG